MIKINDKSWYQVVIYHEMKGFSIAIRIFFWCIMMCNNMKKIENGLLTKNNLMLSNFLSYLLVCELFTKFA